MNDDGYVDVIGQIMDKYVADSLKGNLRNGEKIHIHDKIE